jgi:hypothetical protein
MTAVNRVQLWMTPYGSIPAQPWRPHNAQQVPRANGEYGSLALRTPNW